MNMKTEWSWDSFKFSFWIDFKHWLIGFEVADTYFSLRFLCFEFIYWNEKFQR